MRHLPILALLITTLAACDSGELSPLPRYGNFTVTVTSDSTATFSGNAGARMHGDTLRTISLFAATPHPRVLPRHSVLLSTAAARPLRALTTGTFPIGDWRLDPEFTGMLNDLSDPRASFSADTGSVTVTAITPEEIHGSFWFTGAVWTLPDGPTPSRVEGSFEALILRDPNAP